MKNNEVIKVNNLSKQFKTRGNKKLLGGLFDPQWKYSDAVLNVSFVINRGESIAFLGPNGAGKTTTTKMLTGLVYPTSGELEVLGYTPFDRNHEFLTKIGLVMGNKSGLNWDLSANQSYELLQKIYEIPEKEFRKRVDELTDLLNVNHVLDTQVRKLSLGERMKLELIGAILHDPEVLFLDEPTIGLDISSKNNVREFLRYLHKKGKTLILTSHDMDDIVEVCERALVINNGQIIYDDSMQSLNHQYSHIRYAKLEFLDKIPTEKYASNFGEVVSLKNNILTIGVDKKEVMTAASKLAQEYPIQDVTIEQVPLEVIISDLYSKN